MPGSFEGAGDKALAWLAEAKAETGLPVMVEVATASHVEKALGAGIDAVWIGARTTVSPFAVQEIADALRGADNVSVLVKNPVNPDISLWSGAVERLLGAGISADRLGLIHRGFSCFGRYRYRNAPMWHLALEMRGEHPDIAMLCDPSHIGGAREYIRELSQIAADLRYDGLFVESHICPDKALSDAAQQLRPADLAAVLDSVKWRAESASDPHFSELLSMYRGEIDHIDAEIFSLLGRRMELSDHIGEIKRTNDVAILQDVRWRDIVDKVAYQAEKLHLSEEFVHEILNAIHTESINRQNAVMNKSTDEKR
jgi:chorismate mutase